MQNKLGRFLQIQTGGLEPVHFLDTINIIPAEDNPSCRQTTAVSDLSHPLSHTVPHLLLWQISTRPSRAVSPWTNLMLPSGHPWQLEEIVMHFWLRDSYPLPSRQLTPASWACVQELASLKLDGQFSNALSLPVHWTLCSHILPAPSPKLARGSASRTIEVHNDTIDSSL